MEFLKDHIGFASTDTNMPESEGEEDSGGHIISDSQNNDNASSESSPAPRAPRSSKFSTTKSNRSLEKTSPVDKVISYLNSKANKFSSTEHVMLGYAKAIDGFSARRKITTKMKIAQIMMEAELEEEQERSQEQENISIRSYQTSQQSCYSYVTNNSVPQSPYNIQQDPIFSPSQTEQPSDNFDTLDFENEIDELPKNL